MIAGETEKLIGLYDQYNDYDNFNLKETLKKTFKRKNKKTPEEKEARKKKRKGLFDKVTSFASEGGLEGLGDTASNIFGFLKKDKGNGKAAVPPDDYQVNLGDEIKAKETSLAPALWVIGGVVVIGGFILLFKQMNKNKAKAKVIQQPQVAQTTQNANTSTI